MNTDFEKRLDRVQKYQGVDDRFTFQRFGDTTLPKIIQQ